MKQQNKTAFFYKTKAVLVQEKEVMMSYTPHATPRTHANAATFFFEHPDLKEVKVVKVDSKNWCNIL